MNSSTGKVAIMQRSLEFCSHQSLEIQTFQKQPGAFGVQISNRTLGYIMTAKVTQMLFLQIFSAWLVDG